MFIYFFGVDLRKFNVLHNPSSPQHYDSSHYSFMCNIESKHFKREYTFRPNPRFHWTKIELRSHIVVIRGMMVGDRE